MPSLAMRNNAGDEDHQPRPVPLGLDSDDAEPAFEQLPNRHHPSRNAARAAPRLPGHARDERNHRRGRSPRRHHARVAAVPCRRREPRLPSGGIQWRHGPQHCGHVDGAHRRTLRRFRGRRGDDRMRRKPSRGFSDCSPSWPACVRADAVTAAEASPSSSSTPSLSGACIHRHNHGCTSPSASCACRSVARCVQRV